MRCTTSRHGEIEGKRFSGTIEIGRRSKFLDYVSEGAERYKVKVQCYVMMENHFHLVAATPDGNLSKWMHQLKSAYTVFFNRRHQVVGHLFQGFGESSVGGRGADW